MRLVVIERAHYSVYEGKRLLAVYVATETLTPQEVEELRVRPIQPEAA